MGNYREYQRPLRGEKGILNKIKIERAYPNNHTLSFLLVEGITDERLYQTYTHPHQCKIIVANNKNATCEILARLEADSFPGVLAIVDADFDVLDQKISASQNLFLTDAHDLELMIIQSLAFEKFLNEFGSVEKVAAFVKKCRKEMRIKLLELVQPLGYLRWLSLRENLSLKFEDLSFKKFVDENDLSIDVQKLIRMVQERSEKNSFSDNDMYLKIQHLQNSAHDLYHVCCGHDIVELIAIALRKVIGSKSLEPDLIGKCLRLAYEHTHFSKTQLYASLQNWQSKNVPFVVLRVN